MILKLKLILRFSDNFGIACGVFTGNVFYSQQGKFPKLSEKSDLYVRKNVNEYYLSGELNYNNMNCIKNLLGGLCLLTAVSCGSGTVDSNECNDVCNVSSSKAVIENIMARRSIRKYQPQTVSRDTMKIILECGINAPNGQNKQSWEVRVVDNPVTMDYIKTAMSEGHDTNVGSCFRGAPVMVFIARDPSYDFSAYDCGLLAQNMMLSATSLGIGSICLGSPIRFINESPKKAEILSRLGFSDSYELCLCVGFGYPAEAPDAKPRDWNKVKFVD